MYQKNPILEFSPGDIIQSVRSVTPHMRAAIGSGKNFVKRISGAKRGQKLKQAGRAISDTIKNDPTLFGDTIRGAEAARSVTALKTIQNMAPLPTPDFESIKNVSDSFKTLIRRGGDSKATKRTALRARKVVTNPIPHAKRFVNDRATLSTFIGSPINNYNGIISKLIGATAPIIDSSATMVPLTVNKVTPKQLKSMIKGNHDATLGAMNHAYDKFRTPIKRWLNNRRNQPIVLKSKPVQPQYNTLPIRT